MNVSIQTSSVTKTGNMILEKQQEFKSEIQQFLTIIEQIDASWDGADSIKYINILKEKYIVGLNDLKDILEEYGAYLKNVGEAYQILDEVFTSKNIDV